MSDTLSPEPKGAAAGDADEPAKPLRIGLAGLGTVGCGLIDLINRNGDLIARRAGRRFAVSAVSARNRHQRRDVDVSPYPWRDNPLDIADPADVDVVVELIGGADGPALAIARAALSRGLPLVTANKALIAHHGAELATLAESTGTSLHFEAGVAGGIPIVKTLKEGLAANRIDGFKGILNGTANFILTLMEETGSTFEAALAKAQEEGYAEADPSFDIDGVDAAHKTAILTSLAFGVAPDMGQLPVEGIRAVSHVDIRYARELGYRIKLLGLARMTEAGLDQRVQACLIPTDATLAKVGGVSNAIQIHGNFAGPTLVEGLGAGAGPTASAVAADLIDVARGQGGSTFSQPAKDFANVAMLAAEARRGAFYVRLRVTDRTGVMAQVATAMRDGEVSMERMIQGTPEADGSVHMIITTHETSEAQMQTVIDRFKALDTVLEEPCVLRIEHS